MLKPLEQWICDVCGDVIEKPEDGCIIWREDKRGVKADFKVIHHIVCDPQGDYNCWLPLGYFLGEDGVVKLTSWLSAGPVSGLADNRPLVKDFDEFVDLFRRMQLSYYEEARPKFRDSEIVDGFSGKREAPYLPDYLRQIASSGEGRE